MCSRAFSCAWAEVQDRRAIRVAEVIGCADRLNLVSLVAEMVAGDPFAG
jgi:hypothetical protein